MWGKCNVYKSFEMGQTYFTPHPHCPPGGSRPRVSLLNSSAKSLASACISTSTKYVAVSSFGSFDKGGREPRHSISLMLWLALCDRQWKVLFYVSSPREGL